MILFVGIFKPFLLILFVIVYKMTVNETMRIGDTGVVEPEDQAPEDQVPEDQVPKKTVELPTIQAPDPEIGTNEKDQKQKIQDIIRKKARVTGNDNSKNEAGLGK